VSLEAHSLESLGQSEEIVFDVAQKAVTLINPDPQDLDAILPAAPFGYENIVIFTDTRAVRQCARCQPIANVSAMGLANALVSIYGPQTSGQIAQQNLSSFTFQQLNDTLDYDESEVTQTLAESLRAADWVVFNTLDLSSDFPESRALLRVLEERPDLLSGKKVVVFTLGVPTYLDATNISKVNAYYALYSKTPAFLDVAARVLMKELDPPGALPVSLSAVGYDLITMTSPNPSQVIGLELVYPQSLEEEDQGDTSTLTQTPQPTGMPSFNIGDTLTIRTRTILDHNNHIVPDGTMVRFNFRISGEPGVTQQFETTTQAGIAYFNYRIEAAGGLEITATSEPALQSETLQINISPEGLTTVIQISPTPAATATPTQTPIPTPVQVPTPTVTPEPEVDHYPTLGAWALGVIVMGIGAAVAFLVGLIWWGSPRWGLRSALCSLVGSLLAYSFLNVGFEGTKLWVAKSGTTFVVETVAAGLFIGWIGALIWWMRTEGRYPTRNNH
jgi:beta-N-acetylhexosaminidase